MRLLWPLVSILLITLIGTGPFAATARMPVDEVRAGMTGVGVTVFEGTTREEFDVEILGVLRNVMGPRRDVIVARLSGGPLARTGVIQGMSGSPVYIDGRLVGAVSYALGSFPKEPIAGITPIDEMVVADGSRGQVARVARGPLQFPVSTETLADFALRSGRHTEPFAAQPAHVMTSGLPSQEGGRLGTLLRPITTPVVLNGFAPEVHDLWTSAFSIAGFSTGIGAGEQVGAGSEISSLEPGDAVGAVLIKGDLTMAATGTVTMVDDGRVYAFGHPFYNLGPISFPMTRAAVTTLLPSLALSSKIAAIGEVVGTLDQDRATGIFGRLGAGPDMIPVRLHLMAPERGVDETFEFEVVKDQLFSPLLTYTGVLSTFFSWTRELGVATYSVSGNTRLRGYRSLEFDDVFSGQGAFVGAAGAVAQPLATLLTNDIAPVEIDGIDIDITSVEEPRTAEIERVWVDASRIRPGDVIPLHVLSRSYRGAELLETIDVEVPANASGRLDIQVFDGLQARLREMQHRSRPVPDSVEQMIGALNRGWRNNRLYVSLSAPQAGAVVRGAAMPALPPSVLAVLESDRSGSGLQRLRRATLGTWEIRTDYAISGSRTLSIDVEAG